ncbi:hypothetical protein [Agromyces aerolatus]|uniref:hypothetical protein n=1 Tax=Agromyces sp. LY-1074 TaxID=3074080 RepID=UPI002858E607|nr:MULTISPECIES: hypothetical protein [unclassified Agromyces]MDR5698431.1 hypothetical protein [Agromyces sp. LY-1074]MDR5704725.1 hypothetical protein [Agromyces sp. LY-1358]
MSNTGGGRDGEQRDTADAAAETAREPLAPGEPVTDASGSTPGEPVTDASGGAPADGAAERAGDTAVYDSDLIEPADDRPDGEPRSDTQLSAPEGATTTPPAEPGPLGPGDTAIVDPVVQPTRQAPDSVEPPVGAGAADSAAGEAETRRDPSGSGYVPGAPYSGDDDGAETVTADASPTVAASADPGAPVEDEPRDTQSRLDAAVQRANAVPVASDAARDETPDPVAADSVRRETYVPPAAGAAVAGAATLAGEPHTPQTVYVQAPTPPKTKSNRGFGVLVALIGTAVFAALYAAVAYVLFLGQAGGDATDLFLQFLTRPIFWVPIIATFVGFALLVVIINRGPWWMYAVFGLLVGALVYFSYIGAALLTVNAWELTQQQAIDFVNSRWLDPLAIAAGVIAREVPIWLGGWIAKRGRGVAERNRLAMEAYDRELAAGPRPVAR